MKDIYLTALKKLILLFIDVSVCIFCLGGCTESARSESNMKTAPNLNVMTRSEFEFQSGRDRPPTPKTLYAMAGIFAAQGKDTESELLMKRIVREYPEFFPVYNSLAELQMRQRRVSEAINTLSAGLRIRSRDPVLLNNLGMCRMIRKDYEKALEMFTTAAGVIPGNARYRANMAVTLGLMGRYEESLSLFKQVLPEDQAGHNLSVLREARESTSPASTDEKIS